MPRKTSRRFTNNSKQNNEQQEGGQQQQQEQSNQWQQPQSQQSGDYESNDNDKNSLIADMAQGFIQAQAAITDKATNFNNLEIALLLQKVNDQLEEIKRSAPTSSQTGEQSNNGSTRQNTKQQSGAGGTQDNNSKQQADGGPAKELQALLNSVLQEKNGNQNNEKKSSTTQSNGGNKSNEEKSPPNKMNVQTVSQVLAQAQYELANELEASLKKLKQVISESEKLANDMSNLLGEETMKKS